MQREEVRPLLGDVQAGDLPGDAVLALVGDRVPPGLRLGVQIGEVSERAPGPEAAAQVFYRVLHAALLVPTPDIAGHRPEAVVPRVGQEAGMEADEAPVPLGDRGREVVVPGLPGTAPHEGPGLLVTAQEGLEGLAEGEHDGEQPRVGEHQHEGVHGAPDPEHVAELAPVDLGHLGDPERERHERLAGGPGAEPPHEGPQRADPPAVALGPQDLQDVHGGALRILAEQRLDARDKRGEARRPRPGGGARERHAPAPDHLAHARPLHGEVPGDLTQGPVLGEDEAQDLGLGSGGQHGGTSFRGARCTTRPPTGLSRLVSGTRAPLSAANSHCHKGFELDRVSRGATSILRGRNPLRKLALRQYRVSHLGAHAAQEDGHLAGRDRPGRGPRSGRVHVVLVVRPGHGPIPAPPPAAARRMPLALAGRRPAGPLARAYPGIGAEERLAARTAAAADSGHRSPPGVRLTRYLSRPTPLRMDPEGWVADDSGGRLSEGGENPDDDLEG